MTLIGSHKLPSPVSSSGKNAAKTWKAEKKEELYNEKLSTL